jgi:GNAT superfamily N-acetyltransferase
MASGRVPWHAGRREATIAAMSDVTAISIDVLESGQAAAYNSFFRRGVDAHPDTLRIAAVDFEATPFRTDPGEDGATLIARDSHGNWFGCVTVERERGRWKRRHVAWILRMYVDASSTGKGVGRLLLRAALQRARSIPGISKVNLTVAAHNARAVALYASEGFEVFAREEDAFRDSQPRTELSMSLRLG